MKYDHREINKLLDIELAQAFQNCLTAEQKRLEASKHPKFDKSINKKAMDFPSINPLFLELKSELQNEMTKRNLTIEE